MPSTHFTKHYSSPSQLVRLLQSRGLQISDTVAAEQSIRNIGYYRLSAYLHPLIAAPKELQFFKSGSQFDTALALYNFDQELRLFIFRHIATIEVAIRSAIANIVAKESGNIFWMTDETMFANSSIFSKTKSIIDAEMRNSHEDFIKHFRTKYTNPYPPAWMLVEVLPIGTLNHIYSNLADHSLRKKIAISFGLSAPVFGSWLTVIALTRNACAHHARVWNKENAIPPVTPKKLSRPWISPDIAKTRIFYDLCIIKYFFDIIAPANDMRRQLSTLLSRYPLIDPSAMGFPQNWHQEPLWA